MYFDMGARIKIPVDNPIGAGVIALLVAAAVVGIFFWLLSSLMDYIVLPIFRVPKERRGRHLLSRLVSIATLVLGVALLLLFVLPVWGIQPLPWTIEDFFPPGFLSDSPQ
ncbi:MAG: hypothetical protein FWG47_08735 [Propionibacteriaceae bacterium]|nr:hypothetical protein [Propionibacteriaceae bacterium]